MEVQKLTKALRVLLQISLVVAVAAVLAGIYDYFTYATLPPEVDPNTELFVSDLLTSGLWVVGTLLWLVVGVVFLCWIYWANRSLQEIASARMSHSPGGAVGWFFVPIANWFMPYKAMKEMWEIAHEGTAVNYGIVGGWWGFWLLSVFMDWGIACDTLISVWTATAETGDYLALIGAGIADKATYAVLCVFSLLLVSRLGEAVLRKLRHRYSQ